MVSVFDRFPEHKARSAASAERRAKLHANEQRVRAIESQLYKSGEISTGAKVKQLALALIGQDAEPDSSGGLRDERDRLRGENVVLREALEIDRKWLEDFENSKGAELCAERRPQFEKFYADYFAKRVEAARLATQLLPLHQQNAADRIASHSAYLPQLVYGSSPYGHGPEDLGHTESKICSQLREAFEAGYLTGREQFLTGVNWRRA